MASLLVGMISVCAFSSVAMAFNSMIDFTNKDHKLGGKGKGKGGEDDEIKAIIKDLKS